MKNLIFLFATLLTLTCCSKGDKPTNSIDQLPPITQVGTNTADCTINGKELTPKNGINGISGFTSYALDVIRGANFNNIPHGNDCFSLNLT